MWKEKKEKYNNIRNKYILYRHFLDLELQFC